jgi:hypothetical protein
MNVPDGKRYLATQFFLVDFHFDNFERKSLVEQSVDFGAAAQLDRVHQSGSRAFNCPLKVRLQLLDHSGELKQKCYYLCNFQ